MYRYEFSDAISLKSLRLAERPDPVPGPHDIVIRMRAAALNFRDLAIERGRYHIGVSPPLVPLSDGAGEIIETGEAVNRFQVGDLVCPTFLPDWHDGQLRASVVGRRLGGPTDGAFMRRRRSEPPIIWMLLRPQRCRLWRRQSGTPFTALGRCIPARPYSFKAAERFRRPLFSLARRVARVSPSCCGTTDTRKR